MPFKSSLAKSAGKLLGVFREADLSLRGATQGTRFFVSSEVNPREHFDVKLYTGNNATNTQTGLGFSPDLVWIKNRTDAAAHRVFDTIRGATEAIYSSHNDAETTESTALTAFTSDGFTVSTENAVNGSSDAIVTWCWNAGSSTVTNTDGSINSEVRANPDAGFSIVTWDGAGTSSTQTVGHGLTAAPKFILCKRRTGAEDWSCYHVSLGNTYDIRLSTNGAKDDYPTWGDTDPTSEVFTIGQTGRVNESGDTYVGYCWSEIPGYSKFGEFTGTGASGNSITCGFEPTFLMIKRQGNGSDGDTAYGGWIMLDNKRTGNNDQLFANCAQAEGGRGDCSNVNNLRQNVAFLSTGFELGSGWYETNDTVDYIYAAFA